MEQYQFLDTQKGALKEFADKYDEKYEAEWLPQYHRTVNCSTVWYNSVQKFVSWKIARDLVEEDYHTAAQKVYDSMMKGNNDSIAMLHFTFFCTKEKYNIYPIIYTYKIHAEVLKIAAKNITVERKRLGEYFSSDDHVRLINKKILNLYDNEEMISSFFKLLWESWGNAYSYSGEVFSIMWYFLTNLLEVRAKELQSKLLVLFEKRTFSSEFFYQIYTELTIYTRKLNSGNFKEEYARHKGSVLYGCYLIDENKEKQMLRLVSLMCSQLNYKMKDYMQEQTFSDTSFDLVTVIMEYTKALLPYMHYSTTFDTLLEGLQAVLEFVDGDSRSDLNTQKLIEMGIVSVAAAILNMNPYNDKSWDRKRDIQNIFEVVKFNFKSIKSCWDEISLIENLDFVLNWLIRDFWNQKVDPELRMQEFALIPHDGTQEQITVANFKIALLKGRAIEILLELINSGELVTKNAFLTIYSELDPMIIRKNFVIQTEIFNNSYQGKYRTRLLNRGMLEENQEKTSGFIIEIGYLFYYLLVKLDEFQIKHRSDHRYNKQIMRLMPEEVRNDIPFSDSTFIQMTELVADVYKRVKRACKRGKLDFSRVDVDMLNDAKINGYMKFYADTTSQIDLLINGQIITYTFILLPYCRLSSLQQMENFLQKLDRSNPQMKCESLMQESKYLIKEMKIEYVLQNNTTEVGKVLLKYNALWKSMFAFFIIVVNVFILASYSKSHGSRNNDPELFSLSKNSTQIIFFVIGIILLILWILIWVPVLIKTAWMEIYKYDIEMIKYEKTEKIGIRGMDLHATTYKFYKELKGYAIKTYKILSHEMLIFMLMLGASIILGILWNPFFYGFLVIYLIVESPQMNSLLKAIWEPKYALIATIVLMLLLFYLLVLYSYNSFSTFYPNDECFNLWECFLVTVDQSLKNSGIGNYIDSGYKVRSEGVSINYERLLYDNLEYLLIALLLISIISGIIIDKFGELRTRREETLADAKSNCFIWGKESKDIDRDLSCPGFEHHISLQHNLWDYVYFIAYLKYQEEHNPAGYSAIEKHVIDMINDNDAGWFPSFAQ
jgi:large-conductance mechanosensitive channel